jgi:hypothetical protein
METLHPQKVYATEQQVMLSLCVIKHHATIIFGGVKVHLHVLLTSALDEGEWSCSSHFTLRKRGMKYVLKIYFAKLISGYWELACYIFGTEPHIFVLFSLVY